MEYFSGTVDFKEFGAFKDVFCQNGFLLLIILGLFAKSRAALAKIIEVRDICC